MICIVESLSRSRISRTPRYFEPKSFALAGADLGGGGGGLGDSAKPSKLKQMRHYNTLTLPQNAHFFLGGCRQTPPTGHRLWQSVSRISFAKIPSPPQPWIAFSFIILFSAISFPSRVRYRGVQLYTNLLF